MHSVAKLALSVPFFYKASRLPLLDGISSRFAELGERVHAYVITTTRDAGEKEAVRTVLRNKGFTFSLHVPDLLGHPLFLPWCHFAIFRELFEKDKTVSHFLYLEDDMRFTDENVQYWLRGREALKEAGFYPSFLRYELKEGDPSPYVTDCTSQLQFESAAKFFIRDDYCYMGMPSAYQAMYFMDRQLMEEHLANSSSNPDNSPWNIRESAARGLSFLHIPEGFPARSLVGFDLRTFLPDPGCLIHHTANNYVDNPDTELGKIRLDKLII